MGARVLVLGDICLKEKTEKGFVGHSIKELFSKHDVVTCDLGIIVQNEKFQESRKVGPYEYQDLSSIVRCKSAGINMARLAGNHIMDYGISGAKNLMNKLEESGIEHIGVGETFCQAYKPIIKEINGIKIAFFSSSQMEFGCSYENGIEGFAWINSSELVKNIKSARRQVDYIFLFVHAGVEDTMIPMPEWRSYYQTLIQIGCDFVIGTHPHIVQGVEKYENGLIAYSLGNFAYDLIPCCKEEEWNTSIIISFDLNGKGDYEYKINAVKYENGQVYLNNDDALFQKRFLYANHILKDEKLYHKELKEVCLNFFDKYYYSYYVKGAVISGIIDNGFLFHNIGIESHSYLCRYALLKKMEIEVESQQVEITEKKALIWGLGTIGKNLLRYCYKNNITIHGVTDSNTELWGKEIQGYKVLSLLEVKQLIESNLNIIVVISSESYFAEIRYRLIYEFSCENCISWNDWLANMVKEQIKIV